LRIFSAGATDLNLGFTTFWLPDGATLHLSAESEAYFQGPYTANDNKPHGQLWTPVVPGESAVIELFVPQRAAQQPRILLSQIGTGYRDLFHRQKDLTTSLSGPCEIDVVCPQAAPWTNEIRSVALYSISGSAVCTGTLLADTAGDFRNFFLTANHCGVTPDNVASLVVYWNYQSPVCGLRGGGSLAQNQSGAAFRAAKYDVDFTLIELDAMPDLNFNVYYSGWDRSGTAPAGCVGIHHPNHDVKAISFSSNFLTRTGRLSGMRALPNRDRPAPASGIPLRICSSAHCRAATPLAAIRRCPIVTGNSPLPGPVARRPPTVCVTGLTRKPPESPAFRARIRLYSRS
jgi:hypothetical protein